MARRRQKRRTHLGAKNGPIANGQAPVSGTTSANSKSASSVSRIPKSMVIRTGTGDIGPSVSQLVRDFRQMMEPHTASRLKERRSNRLRDYTVMAGPLGVSHLMLFSRSESSGNVNLRLALTPRGPTMHFRVESYSLCKDVKKALRRPAGTTNEFTAPPLLVMNNFITSKEDENAEVSVPKYLESLTTSVFQSLFPAISPATTPLSSIQRVLLLNREACKSKNSPPYVLNLRHYAISTKRTGLPKAIRRLNAAEKILTEGSSIKKKKRNTLPNLGRLADVSDYLLDPNSASGAGFTSGSESEIETDAEVEMLQNQARRVVGRKKAAAATAADEASTQNGGETKAPRVEKRAIKLSELGPRLRLRLVKVEEGVCAGKVMWHEYVHRSREEEKAQDKAWEEKRRLKEERKRVQRENIERKRKQGKSGPDEDGVDGEDQDMYGDDWDSEDFEDDDGDGDGLDAEADEVEDEEQLEEEDEMEED